MPMTAALKRRRDYSGIVLFSYGFRPFFLGAALWAAVSVLLWLPVYLGVFRLPTHLGPLGWHIHEMLYGYVAAAIAGFLLTAIPNWTGRLPVNGWPLAALAGLWLAGRIALAISDWIGPAVAVAIDVSFLATLLAFAAREIVAGRNWRNLRVLVVIGVLVAANLLFHVEILLGGVAEYGIRIAIAAVLVLITLIGGRIVPSFTNNWLARRGPGRLPAPFGRFDVFVVAASAAALVGWIALPDHRVTGAGLMAAGLLQAVRLSRWAGDRTLAERLVLILHVGYAFVPLGFLLTGVSSWWSAIPPSAGVHAWTAGAFGLMTLAVMTRASLGHTGQPLIASVGTQLVYGFALVAALARMAVAVEPSILLLQIAAAGWVAAFGGFVVLYGPLLIGQSRSVR